MSEKRKSVRRKEIRWIEDENGCYICTSHYKNKQGRVKISKDGHVINMARVIWEESNGKIPEGMNVLHKCDCPSCIRLSHLFLGTQADNIHDMENKGRGIHPQGNQHGNTKINDDECRIIRKYGYELTLNRLCEIFQVSKSTMQGIRKGYTNRRKIND